jgi:hypothetical protein
MQYVPFGDSSCKYCQRFNISLDGWYNDYYNRRLDALRHIHNQYHFISMIEDANERGDSPLRSIIQKLIETFQTVRAHISAGEVSSGGDGRPVGSRAYIREYTDWKYCDYCREQMMIYFKNLPDRVGLSEPETLKIIKKVVPKIKKDHNDGHRARRVLDLTRSIQTMREMNTGTNADILAKIKKYKTVVHNLNRDNLLETINRKIAESRESGAREFERVQTIKRDVESQFQPYQLDDPSYKYYDAAKVKKEKSAYEEQQKVIKEQELAIMMTKERDLLESREEILRQISDLKNKKVELNNQCYESKLSYPEIIKKIAPLAALKKSGMISAEKMTKLEDLERQKAISDVLCNDIQTKIIMNEKTIKELQEKQYTEEQIFKKLYPRRAVQDEFRARLHRGELDRGPRTKIY